MVYYDTDIFCNAVVRTDFIAGMIFNANVYNVVNIYLF